MLMKINSNIFKDAENEKKIYSHCKRYPINYCFVNRYFTVELKMLSGKNLCFEFLFVPHFIMLQKELTVSLKATFM